MRNIYFLLNLLLIFTLNKHYLISAKEALAELWDVEDDILNDYLAIEKKLTELDNTLQQSLKNYESSFGGTYIDVKTKKVYVNTVDDSKISIIQRSSKIDPSDFRNFIDFTPANNSMATLKSHFAKIFDLVKEYKPVNIQVYIDMRCKTLEAQMSKRNLIHPKILYGEGIYNSETDGKCSLGFWARNNETQNYIVTAGHCYKKGEKESFKNFEHFPWDNLDTRTFIGNMIESDNVFKYDFGLIKLISIGGISKRIRNTDSNYTELNVIDNKVITSHGAHICKSGQKTHVTCGHVIGLNTIVTNAKGLIRENYILYGKDSFQITCSGDSGSSVFSYSQSLLHVSLIGIHIGRLRDYSEAIPLDIIYAIGGVVPV